MGSAQSLESPPIRITRGRLSNGSRRRLAGDNGSRRRGVRRQQEPSPAVTALGGRHEGRHKSCGCLWSRGIAPNSKTRPCTGALHKLLCWLAVREPVKLHECRGSMCTAQVPCECVSCVPNARALNSNKKKDLGRSKITNGARARSSSDLTHHVIISI